MSHLEAKFGVPPLTGRNRLVITSPTTGLAVMGTIRSPSDNIANASVTESHMLYYLPHWTNTHQDKVFVRITNTTGQIQQVRGTLWDNNGHSLGTRNAILVDALQPYATAAMNMQTLANLFSITTLWEKQARLEITAPTTGIKLMNMNRSQNSAITNLSGATSN